MRPMENTDLYRSRSQEGKKKKKKGENFIGVSSLTDTDTL